MPRLQQRLPTGACGACRRTGACPHAVHTVALSTCFLSLFTAEIEVEVPVEHGLLVENLLDLAHAPFTHTTTFARGWPVS